MKPKVYIDGKDGTTGLQIYDRLAARDDIGLLLIDEAKKLAILVERDKKILRQRELANLTRAQLAERLEVSQALLYQWEHCEVEPDVRTLKRIADILQCEILELI